MIDGALVLPPMINGMIKQFGELAALDAAHLQVEDHDRAVVNAWCSSPTPW